MKIPILTALASMVAASCLLGADLKVVLMTHPKDGPSPITFDPKFPTFFMGLLDKSAFQMLTSDDTNATPKMRLLETRVIHGVNEGKVYKVVPDSSGLKGYQSFEFSYRMLKDGFMKVDLVRVIGENRLKTSLTIESHLLLELKNPTTEQSVFCALGIETGKHKPGQQAGADQSAIVPNSKPGGERKSKPKPDVSPQ